jgi:hypothetical protein
MYIILLCYTVNIFIAILKDLDKANTVTLGFRKESYSELNLEARLTGLTFELWYLLAPRRPWPRLLLDSASLTVNEDNK